MHDRFIVVCGGKPGSTSKENSYEHRKRNDKPDTYKETLMLWNTGKTIVQIAKARRLKEQTILDHIEKLVMTGKINRADFSRIITPSLASSLPKIHAVFRELDTDRLSPVFEKLGGMYSYDELRIARIMLKEK